MVHKWLLRKAREKILTGLILLFILGPIAFIYIMSQPIEIPALPAVGSWIPVELLIRLILEGRARIGATIGVIGVLFAIFGIAYLLATVILGYNKKRRHAHRSNHI